MKQIFKSIVIITIVLLLFVPSDVLASTNGSPSVNIEVSKGNLEAGDLFDLTINLDSFEEVNSFQIELHYDSAIVEPQKNKAEAVGFLKELEEVSDYVVGINKIADGKVQFAVSLRDQENPFSGSDKLIKIPFKLVEKKDFSIHFDNQNTIFTHVNNPGIKLSGVQLYSYNYDTSQGGGNTPTPSPSPTTPTTPTPPSIDDGESSEKVVEVNTEVIKTLEGKDIARVTYDKKLLKEIIESLDGKSHTLLFKSDKAVDVQELSFTGDLLETLQPLKQNITIKFVTPLATYSIPADVLALESYYKELKATQIGEISLTLNIEKSSTSIKDTKATPLSDVINFKVYLSSGNGVIELKAFKGYVKQIIKLEKNVAKELRTGVRVNKDGTFNGVPTYFDGQSAIIYTNAPNSLALVSHTKTFIDTKGTWNEATIQKLASKYIINGTTDTTYSPSKSVTRGQLTALLTRSLGIVSTSDYDGRFKDVKGEEWYVSELTAAVETGIIGGFEDETFRSGQTVTRQQAAAMIARALEYVGYKVDTPSVNLSQKYKDYSSFNESSKGYIQTVVDTGIIVGVSSEKFDPQGATRRDQMATILDRFLTLIKFSN